MQGINMYLLILLLTIFNAFCDKVATAAQLMYKTYNVEDYCNGEREGGEIFIQPWKVAILELGFLLLYDGSQASHRIHKCRMRISTKEKFWLTAVVEHMRIRGHKDRSHKWVCEDYIQFGSPARHLVGKFFAALAINLFQDRSSEKLCGEREVTAQNIEDVRLLAVSTYANIFNTASNTMTIDFHQEDDQRGLYNNSFRIVITTFRHASEAEACAGMYRCVGTDIYCIDQALVCDGHINCGFAGSGTDERVCKTGAEPSSLNTPKYIIIFLVGAVGCGFFVCLLTVAFYKIRTFIRPRDRTYASTTSAPAQPQESHTPTAPPLYRQHTLPPYEAVVMSDLREGDTIPPPYEDQAPPPYATIFGDGDSEKVATSQG